MPLHSCLYRASLYRAWHCPGRGFKFFRGLPMYLLGECFMGRIFQRLTHNVPLKAIFVVAGLLFLGASVFAQSDGAKAAPPTCGAEIPTGVRVIRMPETDQHSVTISDFGVSASTSGETYDLSMQIKNGTGKWCITSLALTYVFGDARGQEWTANEYPAVMNFKAKAELAPSVKTVKASVSSKAPAANVGMAPGKDQRRVVFDVYNYIQPRPAGFFDGFHLISAQINYCMGYLVSESK